MGKLDKAIGYLSGGMEFVSDHGVGWRREFIKASHIAQLKIDFVDPTNKPGGVQIGERQKYQQQLQQEGRFKELKEYVGEYRHIDLRFTDYSDFLIVAVDPLVPQWGTANEVYMAENEHKPMFFICKGGLYQLPRWLFDVVELDHVFDNIQDVIGKLIQLDQGENKLSRKWVLVRKFIEENRNNRLEIEKQLM